MAIVNFLRSTLCTIIIMAIFPFSIAQAMADETKKTWVVAKMSGDVWLNADKPQKIALQMDQTFKKGDRLTTGQNGRVLLKRGQETILIAPGTTIALPVKSPDIGKTQILQESGEILLEVEKRNVKHFEVQTQYLAAVVKGTQFRVTVDTKGTSVDVMRGKVEVTNFKTGKYVLVLPGQSAKVTLGANGKPVLDIAGKGKLQKIKQGKPGKSLVKPGQFVKQQFAAKKGVKANRIAAHRKVKKGGLRIGKTLGPVKFNIAKATKGISRSKKDFNEVAYVKKAEKTNTVWSNANGNGPGNNNGNGLGLGLGNGNNAGGQGNGLALGLGNGNGNGLGLGLGNGNGLGLGKGLTP